MYVAVGTSNSLIMFTLKLHVLVCRQVSLAVQVTRVDPIGKVEPLEGVQTTVGLSHPPPAEGESKVTGRPPLLVVYRVISAGQVNVTGGASLI